MKKMLGSKFRPVNPTPAALITSVDDKGAANIISLGEVFNISISQPVIVGIAIRPATYSYSLIQSTGEFVVNLTTSALAAQVDGCGRVSGRDGVDKFKEFGLTPLPASFVRPPLIGECPVNIECKVIDGRTVGDHELFLGEVLAVHANEDVLDAKGRLDTEQLDLLIHLNGGYWKLGEKIANLGFSASAKA